MTSWSRLSTAKSTNASQSINRLREIRTEQRLPASSAASHMARRIRRGSIRSARESRISGASDNDNARFELESPRLEKAFQRLEFQKLPDDWPTGSGRTCVRPLTSEHRLPD